MWAWMWTSRRSPPPGTVSRRRRRSEELIMVKDPRKAGKLRQSQLEKLERDLGQKQSPPKGSLIKKSTKKGK